MILPNVFNRVFILGYLLAIYDDFCRRFGGIWHRKTRYKEQTESSEPPYLCSGPLSCPIQFHNYQFYFWLFEVNNLLRVDWIFVSNFLLNPQSVLSFVVDVSGKYFGKLKRRESGLRCTLHFVQLVRLWKPVFSNQPVNDIRMRGKWKRFS